MRSGKSTSSSSSSSSSSESEEITTGRIRGISETSRNTHQSSVRDGGSVTNTINRASVVETATIGTSSPAASYTSAVATGTPYDSISLATTTNTGFSNTATSQQSIPVLPPPILQPPPPQQRLQVDVASAHQQYQQQGLSQKSTPHTGSTISSSAGSLSTPGSASLQQRPQASQPRFDVAKAIFNQADKNHDGSISRSEFQQWAGSGQPGVGQYNTQQQTQFAEHISMQQAHGELLGFEQFRDDSLQIDYGAIEAYNTAMQSGDDFTGGQPPAGGQRFDVAKAIFNQVDANHDGAITRDEFRQWAQGNRQNVGGQTTSQSYGNSYEANTGNIGGQQQVFAGDSPDVANILQQSGLGQAFGHCR